MKSQRETSATHPSPRLDPAGPLRAVRGATRRVGCVLVCASMLLASAASASFSAARVYRDASPGVVVIFGFDAKGAGSSGSGSVVTRSGMILTRTPSGPT